MAEPTSTTDARVTNFVGSWLPSVLRRAGDWLDDHYYDGHPLTVIVRSASDAEKHHERWIVAVVQDV